MFSGVREVLYYLDTVIVIYAVEGNTTDQQRTQAHLSALEQAGHQFAISELTRTEFSDCLTVRGCRTSCDSLMVPTFVRLA